MTLLLAIVAVAISATPPVGAGSGAEPDTLDGLRPFTAHAPIVIRSNSDFTASNGVTRGNGSSDDPYVIEGWDIDATTAFGIRVETTTASFVIQNVSVHSGGFNWQGIFFNGVSNAVVRDVNLTANAGGIALFGAQNVTIEDSWIVDNRGSGVYVNTPNAKVRRNHLERNDYGVQTTSASNVTVEDNTFLSNAYGIYAFNSWNVTAANNSFVASNVYGMELVNSFDYAVVRNHFSGNAVGLALQGSQRITVGGNEFEGDGIVIEGEASQDFDSHSIATNNSVNGLPLLYQAHCTDLVVDRASVGQVIVASCARVAVTNNEFSGGDLPIQVAFSQDVNVSANVLSGNDRWGIRLFEVRNATLMDNDASGNGRASISIERGREARIAGNVFVNDFGFQALRSMDVSFVGNVFRGSAAAYFEGPYVIPPDLGNNTTASSHGNLTIDRNDFEGGYDGILVQDSRDVSVTGNRVEGVNGYGIVITRVSDALVVDNFLNSTNLTGIAISVSANATVQGNLIHNSSSAGVSLYRSTGIQVYGNNFSQNAIQALDDRGSENAWDGGYPAGGNVWSDYTGADECSGPDQDVCPDPDGLGDVPYVIDGDTRDRYPRVPHPAENTPPRAQFGIGPIIGTLQTTFALGVRPIDAEDPPELIQSRWDWEGDGVWDTDWTTQKDAYHQYAVPGNYLLRVEVRDSGGLTDDGSVLIVVDGVSPVTTAEFSGLAGSADWFLSTVDVFLTATDERSGVGSIRVRIEGGNWLTYGGGPIFINLDGEWLLEWYATDVAGNEEPVQSRTVRVDRESPSVTAAPVGILGRNGWFVTPVAVTLSAIDVTSGVRRIEFRTDDGPWLAYSGPVILDDGTYLFEYRGLDIAGNVGPAEVLAIAVDTTPPAFAASFPSGVVTSGEVLLHLSATDAGSGIAGFTVSVDGGPSLTVGGPTEYAVTLADGDHTIVVVATDGAGNSGSTEIRFRVDTGVFSFSGPYRGIPTIAVGLAVALVGVLAVLKLRPKRPVPADRPTPIEGETTDDR